MFSYPYVLYYLPRCSSAVPPCPVNIIYSHRGKSLICHGPPHAFNTPIPLFLSADGGQLFGSRVPHDEIRYVRRYVVAATIRRIQLVSHFPYKIA